MDGIGRALAIGAIGCVLLLGCSEEASNSTAGVGGGATEGRPASASGTAESPPAAPAEVSPEDLIEAGRVSYNANCIACHSMDPTQDGALGPAVATASLELLEARVLRAEYPEGYAPKRNTRVMVALPHLERQLPALAAYLDSLE